MAKVDTDKVRTSAQTLMARADEIYNIAVALASTVDVVGASNPIMAHFTAEISNVVPNVGQIRSGVQNTAHQMIAYADRVDSGA